MKIAHIFHKLTIIQFFAHIGSLIPFFVMIIAGFTNQLTVNPIQEITQRTGRTAIIWLLLSLACTPANIMLGFKAAIKIRRPLGLYAAFYAFLHFLTFAVLDNSLDLKSISRSITEKPFIVLGIFGITILTLLTITSTDASKIRLKKNWRRLHRLVYLAVIVILIHYFLALKNDFRLAIFFSVVIVFLFLARLPWIKNWFANKHPQWIRPINQFMMKRPFDSTEDRR
jgi:sulfoxide reductase heme-binding subunit YedZ